MLILKRIPIQISLLFFFFNFLINSNLFAQTKASDYIPADPTFVLTMNPKNIQDKVDLNQLMEMDFFKSILGDMAADINFEKKEKLTKALENPSKYGMDFNSTSYFTGRLNDEGSFFSYVFNITDAKKLNQFFRKFILTDAHEKVKSPGNKIYSMGEGSFLSWNDDVVILTNGTVEYEYVEYTEDEFAEAEMISNQVIEEYVLTQLEPVIDNPLKTNIALMNQGNDMHMWLDYGYAMQSRNDMGDAFTEDLPAGFDFVMEAFQSMYDGAYMSWDINFDNGAVNIDSKSFFDNPALVDLWKNSMDTKINKKFQKYLRGDNLMMLYSFAYDMEKTGAGFKNLMVSSMKESSGMGDMANTILDIIGIAIDEEALYNLFKGDMVFAITGMRTFEKMITTFDYDEDFNRIEKEEMSTQNLPEFTMMTSYGNEDDMMKFIKLGLQSSFLEKRGEYYEFSIPSSPMNLYVAMNKGILFFSNDTNLIRNKLKKGIPRKNRLKNNHREMMTNNSQLMYWDIDETMKVVDALGFDMGFSGDQIFNMTRHTFDNITVTTPKVMGNTFNSKMQLNLDNKEANALQALFEYFNDIYITQIGGRSM